MLCNILDNRTMTKEELTKLKIHLPVEIEEETKEDEYGMYSTGAFRYKGKNILVVKENGKWHLSVASNHPLGYQEMKEVRYKFMPDGMDVAQIFPSRANFVNLHENCFHLWEL